MANEAKLSDTQEIIKQVNYVRETRTAWLTQHGVPISMEFVRFAEALGLLLESVEAALSCSAEPTTQIEHTRLSEQLGTCGNTGDYPAHDGCGQPHLWSGRCWNWKPLPEAASQEDQPKTISNEKLSAMMGDFTRVGIRGFPQTEELHFLTPEDAQKCARLWGDTQGNYEREILSLRTQLEEAKLRYDELHDARFAEARKADNYAAKVTELQAELSQVRAENQKLKEQ